MMDQKQIDRLNELAASDAAVPGLSTGLGDLDLAISGLNKSDLILLAARPGMGKTSMALNILLHAGKFSGKSVAFFSLEMSREQLVLRLISNESFVDNKKLVTGKLNESDWEKVAAAADALILSRIAQKVILVHRRDSLRATKVYHRPLMEAENLEFRWNSVVTELLHGDKLTGVKLRDVNTGEETVLPCDGVFISVGRKPATELVQGQLELDRSGYVAADETTKTSLPGVYAVGDVRTKPLRQVVTAVSDGATAVHMAEEYLAGGR